MQDADLFLELAAIAGVFVGFGALIAVRSGGPSEPEEISPIRVTVGMGVLAIIAALAPVTFGRYDLTEHQVLALSSVVVLTAFLDLFLIHVRSPEYRAYAATASGGALGVSVVIAITAWMIWLGGVTLVPVVIVAGVAPELEAALYFTVVVLILLMAAWSLMSLVVSQRRPQRA